MSVLKYTVVVSDGDNIAAKVQQHLDAGWRLEGNLTSRRYEYAQAMTRKKTQAEMNEMKLKGSKDEEPSG